MLGWLFSFNLLSINTSTTQTVSNRHNTWSYGIRTDIKITDHITLRADYQVAGLSDNYLDFAVVSAIVKF
jgi:hypothetical protein